MWFNQQDIRLSAKSLSGTSLGKISDYRNRTPDDKAKNVLDLVHNDLAGPIEPETKEGFKYSAVFVDDYSGAVSLYLLKIKSDTIVAVQKFLSDVSPYANVKCIRSYNGTEFINSDIRNLMLQNNMKHNLLHHIHLIKMVRQRELGGRYLR